MSRDFDGTTSIIGLPLDAILRPALPITLAMWIKPETLKLCGLIQTNKESSTHRGAWINVSSSSGDVESGYGDNGGGASADRRSKLTVSPNLITAGAWWHVAATIRGATDQTIYLNGADAGGNYSGSGVGMAYNGAVAGRIGATAGSPTYDGLMAEVGFWSVSLSTAEVLSLAKGVSPRRVRPGSLLAHWPLYGIADPEIDLSANSLELASLTAVTLANHAPVGGLV